MRGVIDSRGGGVVQFAPWSAVTGVMPTVPGCGLAATAVWYVAAAAGMAAYGAGWTAAGAGAVYVGQHLLPGTGGREWTRSTVKWSIVTAGAAAVVALAGVEVVRPCP